FGADSLDWPSSLFNGATPGRDSQSLGDGFQTPRDGGEGVALAATAYRAYRVGQADDPAGLEEVFASRRVLREHADLFRDLHRSDPRSADRLARAVASLPQPGTD